MYHLTKERRSKCCHLLKDKKKVCGYLGVYAADAAAKPLQSSPTLCDPIDGSPSGSPIPGILKARTLEWGAIAFSSLKL